MPFSVLIVTHQESYGTALRRDFDPARFVSFSTADFTESINYVRKNNTTLVVLDTELEDVELSVMDIGFALRQMKPDIRFIIIGTPGQNVDSSSLSPVATLIKPVSSSDLQTLLESLTIPSSAPRSLLNSSQPFSPDSLSQDDPTRLVWLKDVSKAAQHLTRLTLESSAQAALITQKNELWAYAGQLSREAAQELTHSIQRYWDVEGDSEMMRFVRLQATEAQHMLYARKILGNLILALVFDAETPFSTIRSQAGKLVKNLAESSIIEMQQPLPAAPTVEQLTPALSTAVRNSPSSAGLEEDDLPPISELLGDVPPPIPPRQAVRAEPAFVSPPVSPQVATEPRQQPNIFTPAISNERALAEHFSFESSPAIPVDAARRSAPVFDPQASVSRPAIEEQPSEVTFEINSGVYEVGQDMQLTRKQEVRQSPESLADTRPQPGNEPLSLDSYRILLEPASPELANLCYACLLIPRFASHHLVGDVASRLTEWISQICVAFGWRVEGISVRPDYLQWVARVPPSTAPGYLMRIMRQHTSERIFTEFPRFKWENPSGDFWAPGYLLMGSQQLHPQKLVRDFIKITRSNQGV